MTQSAAKERPILFSGPMVQAILTGRKTQTRRALSVGTEFQPSKTPGYDWAFRGDSRGRPRSGTWQDFRTADLLALCPYGRVGDRLWVRESHCLDFNAADMDNARQTDTGCASECRYSADGVQRAVTLAAADVQKLGRRRAGQQGKLQPGRFMYRSCSRITLEVTGVRVERVQGITIADAKAEGVYSASVNEPPPIHVGTRWVAPGVLMTDITGEQSRFSPAHLSAKDAFAAMWDAINGPGSWAADPWVWVIEFKQVV